MSHPALHWTRLDLRRVAGIDHGQGFALQDLSPQVNLIHGPNGCGKTTTARLIQALLWPGEHDLTRPTASGDYRLVGDGVAVDRRVELDAGHAQVLEAGRVIPAPDHGPAELRARYRLALHELLTHDNADLARLIANASQGGYDLSAATAALGFHDAPRAPRALVAAMSAAQDRLRQAKARQQAIADEVARLDSLRAQRDAARQARASLAIHDKAMEHRQAAARLDELDARLAQFPALLHTLRGDELEQYDQLTARHDALLQTAHALRGQIDATKAHLADLPWPDDAPMDDAPLSSAALLADEWAGLEAQLASLRLAERQSQHAADRLRASFASVVTENQLATLQHVALGDPQELASLADLARQVDQLRAARAAMAAAEEAAQTPNAPAQDAGVDVTQVTLADLHTGLAALGRWLATPAPAAAPPVEAVRLSAWPWWAAAAAMLIGLATLFLGAIGLVVMAAMAVLVAALAAWQVWQSRQAAPPPAAPSPDERGVYQRDYTKLPLPQPTAWASAEVVALVESLIRALGDRHSHEQRQAQATQAREQLKKLDERQQAIDAHRQQLEAKLGVTLELADEGLSRLTTLITHWQLKHVEACSQRDTLVTLQAQAEALRQRINDTLASYHATPAASAQQARQAIEQRRATLSQRREALRTLQGHQQRQGEIQRQLHDLATQRQALHDRLHLTPSQGRPAFVERMNQFNAYRNAAKHRDEQAFLTQRLRDALSDCPADLLAMDTPQLEQAIADLRRQADHADELANQIGQLEQKLHAASQGHDITDATEAVAAAAANLADARDAAQGQVAGAALMQWVRQEAVEQTRPQVFARANELLVHFTQGSLSLKLDDHADKPPRFVARHADGADRPLAELSIGERVQLLLAVRVAFLEHQESLRLPLLLDETLGTADDSRAGLIIDAMIELARQGRQVFYFTAQHDEVGKWASRLQERGVAYQAIDLGRLRHLRHADDAPLAIAPVERSTPPPPEGLSRVAYGRLLDVPPIDWALGSVEQVHLWHVVEDLPLLHTLLERDIVRWGALRTLMAHGGMGLLPRWDGQMAARLTLAAELVDQAMSMARIGRGRPVDRGALEDSPVRSSTLFEQLVQLNARCQGDGRALIAALEATNPRAIPGWRHANTQALREHLEEAGHLSQDQPWPIETIRIKLLAIVGQASPAHQPSRGWLDELVAQLPAPPAPAAAPSAEPSHGEDQA